ncbi:MAG TPA: hypothetical protein PLL77_08935 [Pyrinomonadaceae bacterium]|nr:hypothetical protein [Pyrinomonadaceae bacterium]
MSGAGRGVRLVLWGLAVVLSVPLVLSGFAFINGSLEMFPTAEQHAKARIAASVSFLFFAAIEAAVLAGLFRTRR